MPAAEWTVDEALVRSLIAEQAPAHVGPVRRLAEGWDNLLFRVGDHAIARIPRRRSAVALVANEHRWLPELPPLPLAIPRPLVRGVPSERFPHPWSLVPFVSGDVATTAVLHPSAPEVLGEFLRALHQPAPADAPFNEFRSVPLQSRTPRLLRALETLGPAVDGDAVRASWQELRSLPLPSSVWVHGDLHPSNVIVRGGAPVAVIDFGDLCAGDRAVDLAIGWMLFDEPDRERFFVASAASAGARSRSRGWALCLGLAYAASGSTDPGFVAVGLRAVERALDAGQAVRTAVPPER